MTDHYDPSLDLYVKAALGRKASGVIVMDVHKLTSIADAFIICSGKSNRQVASIAEFIGEELKTHGIYPLGVEGLTEGHWVLMDYGHIIIHVFYEPTRKFYDLEGMWSEAKKIKTKNLLIVEENEAETDDDD